MDELGPAPVDDRGGNRDVALTLGRSARTAGRQAVVSGRWLAETVVELAPRVPLRDLATLSEHHDGLEGQALARELVRSAARVSGGIGATTGGLIAAQELSVAALVLIPLELAVETALVVLVELKLVAELHTVASRPLAGGPIRRGNAAVMSWMSGLAVAPGGPVTGRPDLLGPAARDRLVAALRRRFTRNLTSLAPMLAGAVAAGYLNRRATLSIGRSVARDLGLARGARLGLVGATRP